MTEDLEGEEAALKEDLYSADRRFTEYYNVWNKYTLSVPAGYKPYFVQ